MRFSLRKLSHTQPGGLGLQPGRCTAHSLHRIRDELGAPTWVQRLVLGLIGVMG